MRNKIWICFVLLIVISGLAFTASCAKKTVGSEASVSELPQTEMVPEEKSATDQALLEEQQKEAERQREMERQRQLEEEQLKEKQAQEAKLAEQRRQAEAARKAEEAKRMFLEELVLFDFDSSVLTPTARDCLTRKAQWLKENPNVSVTIEGHCDERGSTQYNLVLGESRAQTAKAFLVDMGISTSRLTSISYGEERPFIKESNKEAWAMNRRAHFVIE